VFHKGKKTKYRPQKSRQQIHLLQETTTPNLVFWKYSKNVAMKKNQLEAFLLLLDAITRWDQLEHFNPSKIFRDHNFLTDVYTFSRKIFQTTCTHLSWNGHILTESFVMATTQFYYNITHTDWIKKYQTRPERNNHLAKTWKPLIISCNKVRNTKFKRYAAHGKYQINVLFVRERKEHYSNWFNL